MTIGSAIRLLRQASGLTQKHFAQQVKITPSYLSLIEGNKREPSIPLLREMAKQLGAPATVLFAAALGSSLVDEGRSEEAEVISKLLNSVRLNLIQERLPLELTLPPTDGQAA